MKQVRLGISCLALIAMTAEASASALCDQGSSAALKTAAVQQELMVAGLTCNATAAYNRFVLADQPQLQKSDADLMAYFRNRDGSEAGYDSYKTKLANLAANKSSAPGNSFCAAAARVFQASQGVPLKDFIAGQHLLIAAPESCAVKFDMVEEAAVAGPDYAMPATPYGASASPPPVARRYADLDQRPDYDAPASSPPPAARRYADLDQPHDYDASAASPPPAARRYADLDQRQDYDAPASPPPPMARRPADPDQRQAYNAPSRVRQEQQEYLDEGWVYGPYGWVPPRPPRRRSWYDGYDD